MAEMEGALRSCMEQLLVAREEREQVIVEAASAIASEQKRSRELQRKLEDANKKAARLAAENSSLSKAVDAKDKLARELKESKSASDGKLADAQAKLDAARKQGASLQYEVRVLQKELEIRSQEREYDLKSVDAAQRQHAESLRKIAQLEAECQRLRAMVRKRLPGPAAIAKMRDEVEPEQQPPPPPAATTRRTRSVTPSSPRSSATPMLSPRSVMPMMPRRASSVSESCTAAARLRVVDDESKALKEMLAKKEAELQFAQMKYADETCKLSVAQRQLKELAEENRQLSDANGQSESWASALIAELEQFRAGKRGAHAMASDMSLLDDFAEVERLEMASGGQALVPSSGAAPKSDHSGSNLSEKNGKNRVQENGVSNGHPEWVQEIWKLVMHKHETDGKNIDTILEEISRALDQSANHQKADDLDVSYDKAKMKEMVSNLTEKITSMIRIPAEENAATSRPLLPDKSEFCARLEHLVHVCHDLLNGEANLEKFVNEVCLVLECIVRQYFSYQEKSDTVDKNTENFDGDESLSTVKANGECDMESPKPAVALEVQTEAHKESIQSAEGQKPDHILVNRQDTHLDDELTRLILHQNGKISQGRNSTCEIESPGADRSAEDLTEQDENQLASISEISAAADKLADCQETITNLSRQLLSLKSPAISGNLDSSMYSSRPSSAAKSDFKPQSLASILAEDFGDTERCASPALKKLHSKKEHGEPDAAPRKSVAQEWNADAALLNGGVDESTRNAVHPMFTGSPQEIISGDPKKKKRSPGLLGRMIFRKKVEGS